MTQEKAIKLLKCREKKCKHFIPGKVSWTFCDAIFTEDSCLDKEDKNESRDIRIL